MGLVVAAQGPSNSTTCGIFLDQGSNSCLLHWQEESLPPSHRGSPLLHFWRIILQTTEFSVGVFFFLSQYFKYFTPFLSCMHGFWGEGKCNLYLCSPMGKVFFSLWLYFKVFFFFFSLSWIYLKFEYDIPLCSFFSIVHLVFSELPGSVVWCLTLIWKRPWCWERLRVGGEEGSRGWDG